MAVKLRLRRVGAKKQPAYRIVAADSRAPRDGRFIEIVGAYNPLTNPSTITFDTERTLHWLRIGAQPTEVVKKMMVAKGVWALFTGEAVPEPVVAAAPVMEPAPIEETAEAVETPAVEESAAPAEEEIPPAAPAEEEITPEEEPEAAEEE